MRDLIQSRQHLLGATALNMVLVFTFWQTATADTLPVASPSTSLRGGAWALQFAITNKDLSAFDGGTASLKYHFSDGSALHLGLSYTASIDDRDERLLYPWGGISERHIDTWKYSLDATVLYLHYPLPDRVVTPYFALGPRGGHSYAKSTAHSAASIEYNSRGSRDWSWNIGVTGAVGVECFPMRRIGLLAEYRSSFVYRFGRGWQYVKVDDKEYSFGPKRTTRSYSVRPDAVRLGLSLYF